MPIAAKTITKNSMVQCKEQNKVKTTSNMISRTYNKTNSTIIISNISNQVALKILGKRANKTIITTVLDNSRRSSSKIINIVTIKEEGIKMEANITAVETLIVIIGIDEVFFILINKN
jgi:hypothetical protein